jgi:undecaprenyl-diphosphatase
MLLFAAFLILTEPKRGVLVILLSAAAVALSDMISHNVIKEIFERVRPCGSLPDVHLLVGCTSSYSLPSSHAVNSSALAMVISWHYRKLTIPMILCVLLVAFSRVYVGAHYPTDVLAGVVLGVGFGLGICLILKRWIPLPSVLSPAEAK